MQSDIYIYIYIYIFIMYTPNCALSIAIFVQETERGRFNRARDGALRAPAEHGGAPGEHARALREPQGALP
jgi:hypothetical protein